MIDAARGIAREQRSVPPGADYRKTGLAVLTNSQIETDEALDTDQIANSIGR